MCDVLRFRAGLREERDVAIFLFDDAKEGTVGVPPEGVLVPFGETPEADCSHEPAKEECKGAKDYHEPPIEQ